MKTINDLDKLFSQPITTDGDRFKCPVCGKKYKTLKGAEKHYAQKDCADIKVLLKGTVLEEGARELYSSICESNIAMYFFRRTRNYTSMLKFMAKCNLFEIKQQGLYFTFVAKKYAKCSITDVARVVSFAVNKDNIENFRAFLQGSGYRHVDSASFIDKYKKDLLNDPTFLIRSIEKSHIALEYIMNNDNELSEAILNLPIDYASRVEYLYEKSRDY